MSELTEDDFPTQSIGNRVYCRTQSSPIAICTTDEMAREISLRLNFSDLSGYGAKP